MMKIFLAKVEPRINFLQDWWNLVIWDNPDLVHFLDCGFNFQTMEEFNQPPFDQVYTHIVTVLT